MCWNKCLARTVPLNPQNSICGWPYYHFTDGNLKPSQFEQLLRGPPAGKGWSWGSRPGGSHPGLLNRKPRWSCPDTCTYGVVPSVFTHNPLCQGRATVGQAESGFPALTGSSPRRSSHLHNREGPAKPYRGQGGGWGRGPRGWCWLANARITTMEALCLRWGLVLWAATSPALVRQPPGVEYYRGWYTWL